MSLGSEEGVDVVREDMMVEEMLLGSDMLRDCGGLLLG